MKRAAAIALLVLFGVGVVFTANAQFGGAEPLMLLMQPDYPRPYQNVTVIPQSTVIDLSASSVTARVDGRVVSEGSGAEPVYVTLGGPGTVTTISVSATTGGQTYTKSIIVRPADVALVVEPQSTAHPFYEGGTLISSEGRVRLVALPDLRTTGGTAIPAANLVYTWRNGEQILESASGIGKSVLSATAPVQYRDARITVTVTSQDRSVVAQAGAFIAPAEPVMRVYRNDPLLGPLFGTALPRKVTLAETEETFRAVPYFFAARPAVNWQVNNVPSDDDQDITVRATGQGSGTALLTVAARSQSEPRGAEAALSVTFGEDRGFNFFGL